MISFCFLSKHSHVSSLRFKFLVLLLLIFCLKVRDQEFPYRRNLARVIVNVEDANDHSPYFTNPLYEASVFESAALGSVVLQVTALDKDKGENAELIYSIEAGESCRDLSTKHDTSPSAAQPTLWAHQPICAMVCIKFLAFQYWQQGKSFLPCIQSWSFLKWRKKCIMNSVSQTQKATNLDSDWNNHSWVNFPVGGLKTSGSPAHHHEHKHLA